MMRQVALTATPREAHGLEVFATLGPKHYSSLSELRDALEAGTAGEMSPAHVADHLYPGSREDAPVTVYLYGNLAAGAACHES